MKRYYKNKKILSVNKRNIHFNFIDHKKVLRQKWFILKIPSIKTKTDLTVNLSRNILKNTWNKYYGPLSKKKRNYFQDISEKKNINYTNLLESKLDVLVFRLNFAKSLYQARHMIKHGFIMVNEKISQHPDKLIEPGSVIKSNHLSTARSRFTRLYYPFFKLPPHLKLLSYNCGVYIYNPKKIYKTSLKEKFN